MNSCKPSWDQVVNVQICLAQVAAELAGVPDRADWKRCQISSDEEAARTENFKARFKPYDIMQ